MAADLSACRSLLTEYFSLGERDDAAHELAYAAAALVVEVEELRARVAGQIVAPSLDEFQAMAHALADERQNVIRLAAEKDQLEAAVKRANAQLTTSRRLLNAAVNCLREVTR